MDIYHHCSEWRERRQSVPPCAGPPSTYNDGMTLRSSKLAEVKVMRRKLSREMDALSRGLDVMICYELDLAKGEILARMAEIEKSLLILANLLIRVLKEKQD